MVAPYRVTPYRVTPGQSLFAAKAHFWIETIALVSVIACGVALAIATLGTAAGAAGGRPESEPFRVASAAEPQSAEPQIYEGMVTDTRCGARHSAAIGKAAGDCARVCVRAGEQFLLVDGDNTYLLVGDPVVLERAAGKRIRIVGTLNGKQISISSVIST
jgi:hypothetical protein